MMPSFNNITLRFVTCDTKTMDALNHAVHDKNIKPLSLTLNDIIIESVVVLYNPPDIQPSSFSNMQLQSHAEESPYTSFLKDLNNRAFSKSQLISAMREITEKLQNMDNDYEMDGRYD